MAIAVTSDASAFKRTANLPAASTAYTMCGWFMLTTDRNTFSGALGIANAVDGASFHQLGTDSDGTTLKIWSQTTSTNVAALSLNTWYFGAMTCSGTGAGTLIGYVRALTANALTSAAVAGTSFTPGAAEWGRDCVTGEFITGRIHACGMANVVLSADELLELSYFHEPQLDGIRSLNVFYPTIEAANSDATVDRSGNARNATATVGALADSPPLLWRSIPPSLPMPASSTGALSGTSSLSFTTAANLVGGAALSAVSTITFTPAASMLAIAPLSATSSITFTTSSNLVGTANLAGTSSVTFAPSANLVGDAALTAASSVTFTPAANLAGAAALTGTSSVTFTVAGDLAAVASGELTGTTSITFTITGNLTAIGAPAEGEYIVLRRRRRM